MGCLHDPANVQQISSKCIQNKCTHANAGSLLDRVNTLLSGGFHPMQCNAVNARNVRSEREKVRNKRSKCNGPNAPRIEAIVASVSSAPFVTLRTLRA